jgi:Cof subfamily protein (haloacid dehalogenase superfamily)
MQRAYDALVLDIDGTLLDDAELLPQRTAAALQRARASGVKVMLATGRSHHGVRELVAQLDLDEPSVVFNGAAVYDRFQDRLIESYTLPPQLVTSLIAHARVHGLEPVVARAEAQYARLPKPDERGLLSGFAHLKLLPEAELPPTEVLRVTLFSQSHPDSQSLYREVQGALHGYKAYCTHFALAALAGFRESHAQVVDVQPECAGKAEALRLLAARHGILAARVVAVGDAGNDVPILRAAGLGVAMGNAPPEVKQVAGRVIGSNNGPALAELIESLFL